MTNETLDNGRETPQKRSQKPVVIYILILFIAAFLLMGLSLLMHQRSNTEALGQLQNSVTAMKEVQAVQDKVIELQDQLADAEEAIHDLEAQMEQQLEQQAADAQEALDKSRLETEALLMLYTLQQQYSAGDFDACMKTMQTIEDNNLLLYLSQTNPDVTAPSFRYQQLKEAVLNHE